MMYEELVKQLRTATTLPVMNSLCQEAADAIEEQSGYVEQLHDMLHRSVTLTQILMDRLSPEQKGLPEPEIKIRFSDFRKFIGFKEESTDV